MLHGFAAPLIAASVLHSFFDGWSIATAQQAAPLGIRVAVPLAVAMHKIPEGIALGAIARASIRSQSTALWWCVVAEAMTLVGGILGLEITPRLGAAWIIVRRDSRRDGCSTLVRTRSMRSGNAAVRYRVCGRVGGRGGRSGVAAGRAGLVPWRN